MFKLILQINDKNDIMKINASFCSVSINSKNTLLLIFWDVFQYKTSNECRAYEDNFLYAIYIEVLKRD